MRYLHVFAMTGLLLTGAIFGFFYAWICSTMWGLDTLPARTAIEAMQAMNASVRNWAFFPAFFLTPVVLGAAAMAASRQGLRRAAALFGSGAGVYLLGGLFLTGVVNVPMNEALAEIDTRDPTLDLEAIWAAYSPRWQVFNQIRTGVSAVALALVGLGFWAMSDLKKVSAGEIATRT